MKPKLTESELFELELIDREIKAANFVYNLYVFVGMPLTFTFVAVILYSLFNQ